MKQNNDDSEEDIDEPKPFKSVIQRYFTQYYVRMQYVFIHTNKLILIGISKAHPIYTKSQANQNYIKNIQFMHTINVSGKHKKNSLLVNEATPLAKVIADDAEYIITSCVRGKLIEMNTTLLTNPKLLSALPETNGYIAIINVLPEEIERVSKEYKSSI